MQLHFSKWVKNNGGIKKTATELGVGEHTLRHWLRGNGCPCNESVILILHLSKGLFSFKQLFNETTRNK